MEQEYVDLVDMNDAIVRPHVTIEEVSHKLLPWIGMVRKRRNL